MGRLSIILMALAAGIPMAYYIDSILRKETIMLNHLQDKKKIHLPNYILHRPEPLEAIRAAISGEPDRISVVAGPADTGKSLILKQVVCNRENVLFIDFREANVSSVDGFVRFFNEKIGARFLTFRSQVVDLLPWTGGGDNFALRDSLSKNDLKQALDSLSRALDLNQSNGLGTIPVVIFDEFGAVLNLSKTKEGQAAIDLLLEWCITVSKVKHQCHVMLSVTDSQILDNFALLNQKNLLTKSRTIAIEDLTESQAEAYLMEKASSRGIELKTEEARAVVLILGGRISDLDSIIVDMSIGFELHPAMKRVLMPLRERILMELSTETLSPKKQYSALNLWKAIQFISLKGAVTYDEVVHHLGGNSLCVHEMIRADILGCRVASSISQRSLIMGNGADESIHSYVITADSPALHHVFKSITTDHQIVKQMKSAEETAKIQHHLHQVERELHVLSKRFKFINLERSQLLLNTDTNDAFRECDYNNSNPSQWSSDLQNSTETIHNDQHAKLVQIDEHIDSYSHKLEEIYDSLVESRRKLQKQLSQHSR